MNTIIIFIQKAIGQGICMMYGANGEILTEKSGNLNLGVPGLMYIGGIAGLAGAYFYENGVASPIPVVGFLISLLCAILAAALGGFIYSHAARQSERDRPCADHVRRGSGQFLRRLDFQDERRRGPDLRGDHGGRV